MERCPLCRARLAAEAVCPRCGADLGRVQAAEAEACRCLRQAVAALAAGDRRSAENRARAAVQFQRSVFGETLVRWLEKPAPRPGYQGGALRVQQNT